MVLMHEQLALSRFRVHRGAHPMGTVAPLAVLLGWTGGPLVTAGSRKESAAWV